jgi:apolipoprotein D and lipocalin family protein
VIDIDEDYQYALVAGSSLKYLWILSEPQPFRKASASVSLKKQEKLVIIQMNSFG